MLAGMFGMFFLGALYLERSLGFSARLNLRFEPKATLIPGLFSVALGLLSTDRTGDLLAAGDNSAEALTGGYQLAFVVGSGFVIGAVAIALTVLRSPVAPEEAVAEAAADPVYSAEAI